MFFSEGYEEEAVNNDKLYKILGVQKTASPKDIKLAFHKLARQHHPDKGGDSANFKKIQFAHEVLSHPSKRNTYDKYGEKGLTGDVGPSGGMADIFDLFSGRGRRRGPRKTEDFEHAMKTSLEEIFCGCKKSISIKRSVLCVFCNGKGTNSGRETRCGGCKGNGVKIRIQRLGPGMMQQMQSTCDDCQGSGEIINPSDRCRKCNGKKVTNEEKKIQFDVEKGIPNGHQLRLDEMGDQMPNTLAGDVVITLVEQPHQRFKRKGINLWMKKQISLTDALCGCKFSFRHLDGRELSVSTKDSVVQPAQVRTIDSLGMPVQGTPLFKGALFIQFDVVFPESGGLSGEAIKKLAQLLPELELCAVLPKATAVEAELKPLEQTYREQKVYEQNSHAEDDDEPRHQKTANCAMQ